MTCEESRALFSELADGRLDASDREACRTHLATCAECRREWEGFQRTLTLLHALPRHRAPAGFADRVLAAAHPEAWPKRLARRLFMPLHVKLPVEAAAVALVGIGAALMTLEPETQWALRDASPPADQAPAPGVVSTPAPQMARPMLDSPTASKTESPAGPAPPAVSSGADTSAWRAPAALESRREPEQMREPPPATELPRDSARGQPDDTLRDVAPPGAASGRSQALKSARAPAVSRVATPGRVTGRLAIEERAEGELVGLFSRVGAVEISRVDVTDGVVVETVVSSARYAELVTGLTTIGSWTKETETPSSTDHVRVRIRMVRRPAG